VAAEETASTCGLCFGAAGEGLVCCCCVWVGARGHQRAGGAHGCGQERPGVEGHGAMGAGRLHPESRDLPPYALIVQRVPAALLLEPRLHRDVGCEIGVTAMARLLPASRADSAASAAGCVLSERCARSNGSRWLGCRAPQRCAASARSARCAFVRYAR
jgi:hypothetical protein